MPVTRDSSTDTGYTNTGTGSDGSVETVSYADLVQVETGSTSGGSGMAIIFSGDASAMGTDTYAEMTVVAMVADDGSSGSISLSADVMAAAIAQGFDPFASTSVWYVIVGPVDSYIQIQELETYLASGSEGTIVIQSTSVDFDGVVLNDPLDCGTDQPAPQLPPSDPETPPPDPGCDCDCGCDVDDGSFHLDGNLAVFAFSADAFGDDSYASVAFDALTIEDSFSVITGVVEVAVG